MIGLLGACSGRTVNQHIAVDSSQDGAGRLDGSPAHDQSTYFYYATGGGGPMGNARVLSENGFDYVIIEHTDRYWVLPDMQRPVYTGVLSAAQKEKLQSEFRLDEWDQWAGYYAHEIFDGPYSVWSYAGKKAEYAFGGRERPASDIEWLQETSRRWIEELVNQGRPWDGPMRYLLFSSNIEGPQNTPKFPEFRDAPPWPLASDAHSIAVSAAAGDTTGISRLATGEDAAKLRAVRDSLLSGQIGCEWTFYVPIFEPDETAYELYVRDSIPLENEKGLFDFLW